MSVVAAINGANASVTAPTNGVALGQPNTAAPPPAAPVAPAEVKPAAVKPPEPYRFKKEISLNGKKVPVDLDELALEREIATGRAAQSRLTSQSKQLEQFQQMNAMLEAGDFEGLARLKGADFNQFIAQRAERAAQMAALTPEQQRIAQLEDALAQRDQQTQRDDQQRAEQAKVQQRQATQQRTRTELFESLKHVGYKLDGPENAQMRGSALTMAAKIQKAAILSGQPPLTPQQLGAEVTRSFLGDVAHVARVVTSHPEFRGKYGKEVGAVFESLTSGLAGPPLLDALGPVLLSRIVQAQLAQLGRPQLQPSNGGVMQQPGGIISAPVTNGKSSNTLDFYTLEAEVRKARGG